MARNFQIQEPIVCYLEQQNTYSFSPNSLYLAALSSKSSIKIIECSTLQEVRQITCAGDISSIEWSPDSELLLVLMQNLNSIQVYFVKQTKQMQNQLTASYASLSGGIIDTESVSWSPDSQCVLIYGYQACTLSIWDITHHFIKRLPSPKNSESSVSYSPDTKFIAILTHENGKDILEIIDSQSYRRKMSFVLSTLDCRSLQWTSDSRIVYIIDSISHHLLQIVNIQTQDIFDHSAYDGFLGITVARASGNSKIIAVGGFDNYIRLLLKNDKKWTVLTELLHETSFQNQQSATIYIENGSQFDLGDPAQLKLKDSGEKGIKDLKWAPGDKYLASISSQTPSALFIWNEETISLAFVIIFLSPIVKFEWSSKEESLLITTGSGFITLWSPSKDPVMIHSTDLMRVQDFIWGSNGQTFAVIDRQDGTLAIAA